MNWKQKLTSRKFWLAVAGFVTGVMLYAGIDSERAGRIEELILAAASVVAYIIGEGLTDIQDQNK